VLIQEGSCAAKRSDVHGSAICGDHVMIVGEHVPQAQADQLCQLLGRLDRCRSIVAAYFFQRGF